MASCQADLRCHKWEGSFFRDEDFLVPGSCLSKCNVAEKIRLNYVVWLQFRDKSVCHEMIQQNEDNGRYNLPKKNVMKDNI